MSTLVYDLETNGFLKKMTRIHCMSVIDPDTKEQWSFRHNDSENTIADGVELLSKATTIVGHNVIAFDIPATQKIFPTFKPTATIRDTLVLCRVAAPDIKDHDFTLWRKDLLPGKLIGAHSLEAWGYRINRHKGDYMKDMQKLGLDPWAAWNQEMEDYCLNDTDITAILWGLVNQQGVPETCISLEHDIHALCSRMERNGFPFDKEGAERLANKLTAESDALRETCIQKYGARFVPDKKVQIAPYWYDPAGANAKKEQAGLYSKPSPEHGEDTSRKWWGAVTVPKRDYTRNGISYVAGAAFCRAKWVEFNPTSRDQVIARLVEDHAWTPVEFTETGKPSIDAAVLETLAETVPVAKDIAELFFLQKLTGMIANGNESWLKHYDEDTGCIHPYTNTGGAVTGRCAHSSPNIGQVPAVLSAKYKNSLTMKVPILVDGTWIYEEVDPPAGKKLKEYPLLGRAGEYGWECRSLFRVPPNWVQVGIDLSGIEFRCLAELVSVFDDGELIDVVLTGDIHQFNMDKTGIPSRDIVKRVLYGLLYGAGDEKLGYTAKPTASPHEAKEIGARLRAQLMAGLPALKKAIDKVQREASRGYLIGLDGRKIKVRSSHSALNSRLQSDAALIAKKWMLLIEQYAQEAGMFHSWTDDEFLGDFAMMAFVHDESQNAVNPERADEFAALAVKAAKDAGTFFNFRCPIDAQAKIGPHWAACH